MKMDIIEELNNAKEEFEIQVKFNRLVDNFHEILLNNLTSEEERVKEFLLNNDYEGFCRIKTKSKRYQYGIEKDKYYNHRYNKTITRFTLIVLDNIDTRNDYRLVCFKIDNRGKWELYSLMEIEDVNLYDTLYKEF